MPSFCDPGAPDRRTIFSLQIYHGYFKRLMQLGRLLTNILDGVNNSGGVVISVFLSRDKESFVNHGQIHLSITTSWEFLFMSTSVFNVSFLFMILDRLQTPTADDCHE